MPCYKRIKVFGGSANLPLAQEIAEHLGLELGRMKIDRFQDGETRVRIEETVRGADVFIVQPTCWPVNDNLVELLIIVDAMRRASAKTITAVIPYYGYARQDRKTAPRDPITAKLVANLLVSAGTQRVVTVDLHAGQIQGFFDIPVDPLIAMPILADYYKSVGFSGVIVSPDIGGATRARAMAERLHAGLAIVDKRRPEPNVAEAMNVIGDVAGKEVLLVDDIIDTAGTVVNVAAKLREAGAKDVFACCTHAVLSGSAVERLEQSAIKEIVVTNTIPIPPEKRIDKIKILSVAPLLAEAIRRIYEELSVSVLFD
ncbi:MAG TPA: ribose-phosphate pyrophosphokinase [Firmicutes bacterium]|nr:ribose-phosphate pyrophosphokinase [Bacillota bacterium]